MRDTLESGLSFVKINMRTPAGCCNDREVFDKRELLPVPGEEAVVRQPRCQELFSSLPSAHQPSVQTGGYSRLTQIL